MKFQQGMGIIEVLVALLLLAVAILGFSAMQLQSVRSTTEAVDRTQALQLMRGLAEKIRANPAAIDTYAEQMNKVADKSITQPTKSCGSANLCNTTELAASDVYSLKQQMDNMGITMDMQPCPSTGGVDAKGKQKSENVMYSYCLITAWGRTNPSIGPDDNPDDGTMDCLTPRNASNASAIQTGGMYHPKATCMFMEVN